jgi:hypothetical protein
MIAILAAATVGTLAFTPRTDSTLTVTPETRLVLENFAGDVAVSTWSKNALRIEADHSSRAIVEIERDGSTVNVRPQGRRGPQGTVDFRITAPPTMALEITGVYADVTIDGTKADVTVSTVRGDVSVTGGKGHVALKSVEGDVSLDGGSGRAELSSVNSGVTVKGHEGELAVETVNGDVLLEDIRSGSVEATTVNGDVLYDGETRDGGHYLFSTHNGDIIVALPAQPSVNVSVTTYSGDFDSSFPVKVMGTHRNRRMRFTLGAGAAELELESFQGSIQLRQRGGSEVIRAREKMGEKKKDEDKDSKDDKQDSQ